MGEEEEAHAVSSRTPLEKEIQETINFGKGSGVVWIVSVRKWESLFKERRTQSYYHEFSVLEY